MRSMYKAEQVRPVKEFRRPSRTKQAFRDECDINNIMRRYEKDGLIAHVARVNGSYGDFTDPPSYQEALNKVISAQDMFMTLPAKLRFRFGNDPQQFLAFVQDEANAEEMYALGLAVKKAPEPPVRVEVTNGVKEPSSSD